MGQPNASGTFAEVALALWIGRLLGHDAQWREELEVMVSVGIALILGFFAVYLSNTDTLHRFVRFLRLTKETSYPSEWYSAFITTLIVTLCCICRVSGAFMDGLKNGLAAPAEGHSGSQR